MLSFNKNLLVVILISLSFSFVACKRDRDFTNIPDSYVNIHINLYEYTTFYNGLGNYLVCPDDLRYWSELSGFGYAGVVMVHSYMNEFHAYDMCCTNPSCVENKRKIEIGEGVGRCAMCRSEFNLLMGYGEVLSGPAKYPLRMYKTYKSSTPSLKVVRID